MSIADDLSRLHELHQRGGLTEAEFALAKARILGETLAAADPRPSQSGDGPASRPALPEYRPTRWPGSAWAAVVALLIVIVILAAPLAYKAFENRLFRNVEWKFFGS